jgi:hypothetical protein
VLLGGLKGEKPQMGRRELKVGNEGNEGNEELKVKS